MKAAQYDKDDTAEDERRDKREAEDEKRYYWHLSDGVATNHGDNCDNNAR
jgi:hypothetical protein